MNIASPPVVLRPTSLRERRHSAPAAFGGVLAALDLTVELAARWAAPA